MYSVCEVWGGGAEVGYGGGESVGFVILMVCWAGLVFFV